MSQLKVEAKGFLFMNMTVPRPWLLGVLEMSLGSSHFHVKKALGLYFQLM